MSAAPRSTDPLELLIERVRADAGFALTAGRRASVAAGVRRALERMGASDSGALLAAVDGAGEVFDAVLAELTVGETYFFREPVQLDFLRREVLPAVAEQLGPGEPIRLWSAGCSSGEEAYSLAIVAEEAGLGGRARVVGSDVSRRALAKAAQATYGPWSLRGVDPRALDRYFREHGGRYALDERLRPRVTFVCENLAARSPRVASATDAPAAVPGTVHVVVCRNVLMYLEPDARARAVERLLGALAPGGWLVTGASDPVLACDAGFEQVAAPGGLAYRRTSARDAWSAAPEDAAESTGAQASAAPIASFALPEPAAEPPEGTAAAEPAASLQDDSAAGNEAAEPLSGAQAAFAAGDWAGAAELAAAIPGPEAAALRVRAGANDRGAAAALDLAAEMARAFPLSAGLRCLYAALLAEAGRTAEALAELRRTLYLDRSLAPARWLHRALLARRGTAAVARHGDPARARRASQPAAAAGGRSR